MSISDYKKINMLLYDLLIEVYKDMKNLLIIWGADFILYAGKITKKKRKIKRKN